MSETGRRRTLLPYQDRWTCDPCPSRLKVIEKSRRIGISWAEASDAVLRAAAGVGDIYYQAYDKDMTRGFIDDCAEWAEYFQKAASAVGETLLEDDAGAIQVFRIGFANGKQIRAMTSSPRVFRGKGRPGDIAIIDEAAFVNDLEAVLTAARAFCMWGGAIHVISTHNGEASHFAALVRDIRQGMQPGELHTVTLRTAIDQGLYKRICQETGQPWSPQAEAQWEADLRAQYGARGSEELDCVPSSGTGAWLSWELISAAVHGHAGDPARTGSGPTFIGIDVARRRDLWVAVVLERVGSGLWCRQLIARRNIRFSVQRQIVAALERRYRPVRIAVDQTGMGEAVVEQLQDDHGRSRVEGVQMTGPRRLDVATALREAVEDRRLHIPADEELRRDLHAVRAEVGPTGAPRLVAERAGTDGHADRFWAIALACAAAAGASGSIDGAVANQPLEAMGAFAEPGSESRLNHLDPGHVGNTMAQLSGFF